VDPLASEVIEAAYALGIGLAIGLEREHSDLSRDDHTGEISDKPETLPSGKPREVILGVRTFALLALVGWGLAMLGDANAMVLPIGLVAVVGLITAQYVLAVKRGTASPGATTEVAAIAVVIEGALVHTDRRLAVVLGLATALLLVSKPWMQRQVVRLRHVEISATIQLAVLVAIVLPLLPAEPIDPWGAVPPRKVGLFVVLIAGVEYVGYVLTRALGADRGAVLTGLVGGLSSSTATTISMARATKEGQAMRPAQLAALLANVVMCVRLAIVTAVLAPAVSVRLSVALAAYAAVLVGAAAITGRDLAREAGRGNVSKLELKNPFSLVPALTWGAVLCGILVVSKLATAYLGDSGFLLAAFASGLADVDAISLAAARAVSANEMSVDVAALAVVIAAAANAISKSVLAISVGGRAFGQRIAVALLAGAAAAVATALVGRVI
jgi:uncharacterized membrane protein (DUF4010 family)